MTSDNQHHIPQFLQRSFGAAPKGRQKEIWQHAKGKAAELRLISETASGDRFYSAEVDEKLKEPEDRLAKLYHSVRVQPIGSAVDPAFAAEFVCHLAPRTAHLRQTFAIGLHQVVKGTHDVLTDPAQVEQLLGLHEDEPTERFRDKLREGLRDRPEIAQIGLPESVMERVAFYVAKESFETSIEETSSLLGPLLKQVVSGSATMARDAHIRTLDEMDDKPNVRRDIFEAFDWTIEAPLEDCAILPDCVALAYAMGEPALPLMYASKDMDAVVMPLTKERLLVGRSPTAAAIVVEDFNSDAAACSESFFLAHSDCTAFATLSALIGSRCERYFADAMHDAFRALLPQPSGSQDTTSEETAEPAHLPRESDLQFSCSIQCADFGDGDFCQRVNDGAVGVITGLARSLPLSRLDSILFALDFPAALRTVDRGDESLGSGLIDQSQ